MRQNISDLDELVLKCRSTQSRVYIGEAVACYVAGAFRACIVSTWIAVVFDFVDKLQQLELAGDKAAKDKVQEFNDIREKSDVSRSLKFERNILDWALNQFELISPLEYKDLSRLAEDRHRCAHPSMSSADELYQPSAELARYHLRNAVEYLLQHPPVQGKAALGKITAEIDGTLFPVEKEAAIQHFRFGPLAKPREALVRNLVIVLTKDLLRGAFDENSCQRRAAALNAIREMHRNFAEQAFTEKLSEIARGISDTELVKLVSFLGLVEDCWTFLAPDVIGRLERYTSQIPPAELTISLPIALRLPGLQGLAKARIGSLTTDQLGAISRQVPPSPEILDRAVELYEASGSFDTANSRANLLIIPLAPHFDLAQCEHILQAACQNDQIYCSFRARPALISVRDGNRQVAGEKWDELLKKFDTSNRFQDLGRTPIPTQAEALQPEADPDIPL